jgi:hypothetical protein
MAETYKKIIDNFINPKEIEKLFDTTCSCVESIKICKDLDWVSKVKTFLTSKPCDTNITTIREILEYLYENNEEIKENRLKKALFAKDFYDFLEFKKIITLDTVILGDCKMVKRGFLDVDEIFNRKYLIESNNKKLSAYLKDVKNSEIMKFIEETKSLFNLKIIFDVWEVGGANSYEYDMLIDKGEILYCFSQVLWHDHENKLGPYSKYVPMDMEELLDLINESIHFQNMDRNSDDFIGKFILTTQDTVENISKYFSSLEIQN